MNVQVIRTRWVDGDVESIAINVDHDSNAPLANTVLAIIAGARFNAEDLHTVTGWVDLSASAAPYRSARKFVDIDALSGRAVELRQLPFESGGEVTGESIFEAVQRNGGTALVVRDETGLIDEIHASFGYEYDYDEGRQILESLQATGLAPQKPLGDLAQTSVFTANGTQEQVVGLAEWSISYKRKTVDTTTTDNAEWESSLASSKSWTAKAKYMFIDADPSQSDAITSQFGAEAANALQNSAAVWNFYPTIATGRALFQGSAIIDGIDLTSGMGKVCGLDVSLKGTGPLYQLAQTTPVANPNTVTGETAQAPSETASTNT